MISTLPERKVSSVLASDYSFIIQSVTSVGVEELVIDMAADATVPIESATL